MNVYVFCSTRQTGKDGTMELAKARAEGKAFAHGMGTTAKCYFEKHGYENSRNGFYDMVQMLYTNEAKIIWLNSISAFCLDWQDLSFLLDVIRNAGHRLFIENEPFSPVTRLQIKRIKTLFDSSFAEKAVSKQQAGRNERIDEGWRLCAGLFGYQQKRICKGSYQITIDKRESRVVQRIYKLYCDDSWSIRKIASSLHEHKTKTGKSFTTEQVKRILLRPEYSGRTFNASHTRLIGSKYYENLSIISRDQSNAARLRLGLESKPNRKPIVRSFYSGLVHCASCESEYLLRKPAYLFHRNTSPKCHNSPKNIPLDVVIDFLTIALLKTIEAGLAFSQLEEHYYYFVTEVIKKPILYKSGHFAIKNRRELVRMMKLDKQPQEIINLHSAKLARMKQANTVVDSRLKEINKAAKVFANQTISQLSDYAKLLMRKCGLDSSAKEYIERAVKDMKINDHVFIWQMQDGSKFEFPIAKRYEEPCWELRVLHFYRTGKPYKTDLIRYAVY